MEIAKSDSLLFFFQFQNIYATTQLFTTLYTADERKHIQ
jgi:hypothetical protein